MTFNKALEIGRIRLLEYEPRLKGRITGIRPYDNLKSNLCLRFISGYSIRDNTHHSRVLCWIGCSPPDSGSL